jgi:hypothetical protein
MSRFLLLAGHVPAKKSLLGNCEDELQKDLNSEEAPGGTMRRRREDCHSRVAV